MLRSTDIIELSRRMKPGECSIRRMAGVYVDADKEKCCYINESFLALEEGLFHKYLKIVKDVFGKKIGDNMLSLEIEDSEMQFRLQSALRWNLQDPGLLDAVYDQIIENYYHVGNYLILLWTDIYDIPRVGKDGTHQDESEEVYEHIICAICPVTLTAAGISYDENNHAFRPRIRDWVVQKPACGFIYPAFEDRTVEVEKMLFYAADPSEPPHDFMEDGLGLQEVETITEINERFQQLVNMVMGGKEAGEKTALLICEQIHLRVLDQEDILLNSAVMGECCMAAGIGEVVSQKIANAYRNEFAADYPKAAFLLNKPVLKKIETLQKKREWSAKCEAAAKEIEKLDGNVTLIEDLRQLALKNSLLEN